VQGVQVTPRLDPEFVREERARTADQPERFGPAARAVQGGHLRGDQPFAGRVLLEQRGQVRDDTLDVAMAPAGGQAVVLKPN
jgi:alpha-glucosidase